jgi:hypothetical protein
MLTLWPVELGELAVRCFHFYTDGLIRFNRDLRGIGCQLRLAQFVGAFPVVNALATAAAPWLHDGGAASSISPRLLQESTHGRENQGKNEKGENVKKERRDSSRSYRGEETDPNNRGTITNVSRCSAVGIEELRRGVSRVCGCGG